MPVVDKLIKGSLHNDHAAIRHFSSRGACLELRILCFEMEFVKIDDNTWSPEHCSEKQVTKTVGDHHALSCIIIKPSCNTTLKKKQPQQEHKSMPVCY